MSDQSKNGGSRHSKLDELDPRVNGDKGTQGRPDDHVENAHDHGKFFSHHDGISNKLDPSENPDKDNSRRKNVAASTPFMPQAGKPAGTQADQGVISDPDHRRENVAASTPFMPQAGKPAGNSSL
ncbi:uncharacterized protein N7484_000732 [Penicillium longicatenatum]|uniref:uncharacterized protein n=1 Tax=Penicillium longicatenatum TaxID=1561947 RepID=UPI00254934C1|nr:uncharacterized protein N7484_000732 [Penicillium longicatenatum]KAJ5661360.1 hypothetical protein N7484_000732 [Penicillium longicatenatum]